MWPKNQSKGGTKWNEAKFDASAKIVASNFAKAKKATMNGFVCVANVSH